MSMDDTAMRQSKLGEMRWVAAVSRPDICARLARITPRINAPCGCDMYRINGLARVAEAWQHAAALWYASSSRPWETLAGDGKPKADLLNREEKAQRGSTPVVGRSHAAYGTRRQKGNADWLM